MPRPLSFLLLVSFCFWCLPSCAARLRACTTCWLLVHSVPPGGRVPAAQPGPLPFSPPSSHSLSVGVFKQLDADGSHIYSFSFDPSSGLQFLFPAAYSTSLGGCPVSSLTKACHFPTPVFLSLPPSESMAEASIQLLKANI